ncbi:MAG: proline hydroxylase [Leptolyngbyaceae cyanobacterium SL_7_1]|nr:proline hydroxylase [Leptolyngbyaceae cyanobacterium SL_7_1]
MPPSPQDVDVTVLLTGGHQYHLVLSPDAPLLVQLFEVMLDQTGQAAEQLLQLPLDRGRSMLCFRGDRLVGLVTDPPIVIQPQVMQPQGEQPPVIQPQAPVEVLPSEFVQLDQFLTAAEHQQLLEYVLDRESEFVSTTTSTGAANYRKSVVLHYFPEFTALITDRIQTVLPNVLSKLNLPPFEASQIEAQLTGHNDGNYYKIHNDNGSPETATRELTYVYYFHQEPKAYSGGELIIYDSQIENNYYVQAKSYHTVEPRNNSIVFFLSRYMHEVLPVRCPSRAFADSRFTINGWVRR